MAFSESNEMKVEVKSFFDVYDSSQLGPDPTIHQKKALDFFFHSCCFRETSDAPVAPVSPYQNQYSIHVLVSIWHFCPKQEGENWRMATNSSNAFIGNKKYIHSFTRLMIILLCPINHLLSMLPRLQVGTSIVSFGLGLDTFEFKI